MRFNSIALAILMMSAVLRPLITEASDAPNQAELESELNRLRVIADLYPPNLQESERNEINQRWHALEQHLVEHLKSADDMAAAHLMLGDCYRMGHNLDIEGCLDKAETHLKAAIEMAPQNVWARILLAQHYTFSCSWAKGEKVYLEALPLAEGEARTRVYWGLIHACYSQNKPGLVVKYTGDFVNSNGFLSSMMVLRDKSLQLLKTGSKLPVMEVPLTTGGPCTSKLFTVLYGLTNGSTADSRVESQPLPSPRAQSPEQHKGPSILVTSTSACTLIADGATVTNQADLASELFHLRDIADTYPPHIQESERDETVQRWHVLEQLLMEQVKSTDDVGTALVMLGDCYRMGYNLEIEGCGEEAEACFKTAIDMSPHRVWARILLAQYYTFSGKWAEGEKAYLEALPLAQDEDQRTRLYWGLVHACFYQQKYDLVVKHTDDFVSSNPYIRDIMILHDRSLSALAGGSELSVWNVPITKEGIKPTRDNPYPTPPVLLTGALFTTQSGETNMIGATTGVTEKSQQPPAPRTRSPERRNEP